MGKKTCTYDEFKKKGLKPDSFTVEQCTFLDDHLVSLSIKAAVLSRKLLGLARELNKLRNEIDKMCEQEEEDV